MILFIIFTQGAAGTGFNVSRVWSNVDWISL